MKEFSSITEANIAEMRSLLPGGDLDLRREYKEPFKQMFGRETTLTEDQLLHVVATVDDDYGTYINAKQVAAGEAYFKNLARQEDLPDDLPKAVGHR